MKICHMTSVHPWDDVRIFLKECQALAKAGYDVYLVAEGIDREEKGVHIVGCGEKPAGRRARMGQFARIVYEKALALDCDVYHFHDPELLPYGVKLKDAGKMVIFDSHEDVSGQILDKEWIPGPLRSIISFVYKIYETMCVKKFDAVVAATPHIAELFSGRAKKTIDINNFPKLDDIVFHEAPFDEREKVICFAGGINELRGESVMLQAMKNVYGKLVLAGPYDENGVYRLKGDNVSYLGKINRKSVNELYGKSRIGIVLYQPAENHFASQPIKMFEYMAAGLPIVASDFNHWKKIIEMSDCGICVNPTDPNAVSDACNSLLEKPAEAQEMGKRGRRYVLEKYNWQNEEEKLLRLYEDVLGCKKC